MTEKLIGCGTKNGGSKFIADFLFDFRFVVCIRRGLRK